jgi:hypothetical protein
MNQLHSGLSAPLTSTMVLLAPLPSPTVSLTSFPCSTELHGAVCPRFLYHLTSSKIIRNFLAFFLSLHCVPGSLHCGTFSLSNFLQSTALRDDTYVYCRLRNSNHIQIISSYATAKNQADSIEAMIEMLTLGLPNEGSSACSFLTNRLEPRDQKFEVI